jgi:hypothetical protein
MGANWGAARLIAPVENYTAERWRQHFADHPDSFLQVLGDTYRIFKSEEAKRNGTANPQGGRRKTTIDGNMTELWSLVTPTFSMEAFPEAFAAVQGDRSLRQVALYSGVQASSLVRYLGRSSRARLATGRRDKPGRYDLERIAKAVDVHPAYFREWRELVITEYLASVLANSPNLSVSLLKAMS